VPPPATAIRPTTTPIERTRLANGLTVIAAPDRATPLVGVAVVYDVGFRSEPEGRTGFAHLFEHLMFQGSANVGKVEHMSLVEGAGGVFNGHTRTDITAYYQALPPAGLELTLWLEADRMRSLAVTEENLQNQVAVVEEEIKVNVLNQPYGGFPFIFLPELAYDTYQNSHNGYGDFADLEKASVEEAVGFYRSYYVPSNAVLVVAGDCDPESVFALARRHFGDIEHRPVPGHGPWSEPPLLSDRRRVVNDRRAPQPAFAVGYRTPDPRAELDRFLAHVVVSSLLTDGEASRLRSRLVHQDRLVTDVSSMVGLFGDDGLLMRDPVPLQVLVHHPGAAPTKRILGVITEELGRLATDGPTPDELERVAASFASAYWRGTDSVMARTISYACLEVVQGRAELASELPARLAAVGASEVAAAAADVVGQHTAVVEIRPAPAGRPTRPSSKKARAR
jgi:zinc protease